MSRYNKTMKYCPSCGHELQKQTDTKFTCSNCGGQHYVNPKGAVAVLLLGDDQTVYLATRARDPQKGKLDCLGGFLDVGENFEQALYRELKEEAGIGEADITDLHYLSSSYDPYPWQGDVTHTASVYFVAKLKEGVALTPNDDVAAIHAYKIDELNKSDFAWDGMRKAVNTFNSQN